LPSEIVLVLLPCGRFLAVVGALELAVLWTWQLQSK
jgi:hypothetical protein